MADWMPGVQAAMPWLAGRLFAGSLQGALVIAVLWLVCRWFASIPASVRTTLWWLASLKLVLALVSMPSIPIPILTPERDVEIPIASNLEYSEPVTLQVLEDAPPAPVSTASSELWMVAATGVWLIGVFLQIPRMVAATRRMRRTVARARPIGEEEGALLAGLATRMGLRTPPDVRRSDDIDTPQVMGIRRPVVLLPSGRFDALTADERAMVLCHEMAHVRRRDLLWGWVPLCAERLFFFHPLARLAAREYAIAREAACDAAVLASLGVAPKAYGRVLIRLGIATTAPGVSAAGSSRSVSSLRRRLDMLQHGIQAGPRRGLWLLAGVIAASMVPFQLVARSEVVEPVAGVQAPAASTFRSVIGTRAMTPAETPAKKDSPASLALSPEDAAQDPSIAAVEKERAAQRARIDAESRLEAEYEAQAREWEKSREQLESALQANLERDDDFRAALLQQLEALKSTDLQLAQQFASNHPARLALLEQIRFVQEAAAQQTPQSTAELEKQIDEMTAKLRELERALRQQKTAGKVDDANRRAQSKSAAAAASRYQLAERTRERAESARQRADELRTRLPAVRQLLETQRGGAIDQNAPLTDQVAQLQRSQELLSRQLEDVLKQQDVIRAAQQKLAAEAERIRAAIAGSKQEPAAAPTAAPKAAAPAAAPKAAAPAAPKAAAPAAPKAVAPATEPKPVAPAAQPAPAAPKK